MRITSTKKLNGVLEIPSVGVQIIYDHQNGKSKKEHDENNKDAGHGHHCSIRINLLQLPYDETASQFLVVIYWHHWCKQSRMVYSLIFTRFFFYPRNIFCIAFRDKHFPIALRSK